MKISFIATYPPRQCGIATFTQNLIKHIVGSKEDNGLQSHVDVVALNEITAKRDYPPEVKFVLDQQDQREYSKAADFINYSDSSLCILQHEFGIYGGESGVYILPLIDKLRVPLIVTFHTILKKPSFLQKTIVQGLGKKAQKLVIMSKLGAKFLKEIYGIPKEKIVIIDHGVPDFNVGTGASLKKKFNFENRKILLTFGLLGRSKGVETVINALPKVVNKHPEVLFIILGNTHPNIIRASGEQYRQYLKLLVRQKGLDNNVVFLKQFVPEHTLQQYLTATDIYITPYLNEAQITSGTLSYAVGAGATCVSTPYWHAKELLADGRGELFDFKDVGQLTSILNDLLDDPEKMAKISSNAYSYGKTISWKIIGKRYLTLAEQTIKEFEPEISKEKPVIDPSLMPILNLDHLKRLTDDTGIIQHAKYGIPNLKEGYCLDDNARALLASLIIYKRTKNKEALDLVPIYFSYLQYMQNANGNFRNFLSFDRRFLDKEGSEDSFGRTIWALGYLIRFSPNDAYHQLASEIFEKAKPNFVKLKSIRGIANTLIGICHYIQRFQSDEAMIILMEKLTQKLVDEFDKHRTEDWQWFENVMTYDNGIVPLALFSTLEIVDNQAVLEVANEATEFLEKNTWVNNKFAPVGSNGWYPKGGECARYPQQATDTMVMVLLYFKVFQIKKRKKDVKNMFQCFTWFLGENDLKIPLFDHETNGCCDGIESHGVNRNQGAESTLAYLISYMHVMSGIELESKVGKARSANKRKVEIIQLG